MFLTQTYAKSKREKCIFSTRSSINLTTHRKKSKQNMCFPITSKMFTFIFSYISTINKPTSFDYNRNILKFFQDIRYCEEGKINHLSDGINIVADQYPVVDNKTDETTILHVYLNRLIL